MNTNNNQDSQYKQFAKELHGLTNSDIDESSLSRVTKHMSEHDCGIITAWRTAENPCNEGKPFTRGQKDQRNFSLLSKLNELYRTIGYGITDGLGVYKEVKKPTDASKEADVATDVESKPSVEEVFFVVDLKDSGELKKDLFLLGKEFDQDSVLFIPKGSSDAITINTNHCSKDPIGTEIMVGGRLKYGDSTEFYTTIRNRAFKFTTKSKLNSLSEAYDRLGLSGKQTYQARSTMPWYELRVKTQTLSEYWTTRHEKSRTSELFVEMAAFPKKNGGLRSKMWILPDGSVVGLDGTCHYSWILANKDRVAKFGLDTTDLPENDDAVKIVALKKGFFRVSYETRSSNLHIEGLKNKLSKRVKDAIFMIVMENVNSLNGIRVALFNDDVTEVKVNRSAQLFTLPSDEEKLATVEDILG
jgi:hypothetical protein